jgi:hypothetical protein
MTVFAEEIGYNRDARVLNAPRIPHHNALLGGGDVMANSQCIRPSYADVMDAAQQALFWAKVDKRGAGGCWVWTAATHSAQRPYGVFGIRGKSSKAHRISWELLRGRIPDDLVLDHICRNHGCVNPDHLEPVTLRENVLRGVGITAIEARQTHCKYGHALVGGNLRRKSKKRVGRQCATCWRRLRRDYMRRRRAETIN